MGQHIFLVLITYMVLKRQEYFGVSQSPASILYVIRNLSATTLDRSRSSESTHGVENPALGRQYGCEDSSKPMGVPEAFYRIRTLDGVSYPKIKLCVFWRTHSYTPVYQNFMYLLIYPSQISFRFAASLI